MMSFSCTMLHKDHSYWMDRCLTLARKGRGAVSPNPLVGAVIVKHGRCIGQGYHRTFGGPHAEVEAIRDAESRGHDITDAIVYVSLEPCSHHGKTPPCADALIVKRVRQVVIAVTDPNPLVAGNGIRRLRAAGIRCTVGVREREAVAVNRPFFTFIRTGMPLVALKAAQTADGFIARPDGSSKWISSPSSRRHAHRLRTEFDAVLVGARTVIIDDPALTVRSVRGRDPVRVVVDGRCSVPVSSKVFRSGSRRFYFVDRLYARSASERLDRLERKGVEVIRLNGHQGSLSVVSVLKELGNQGIASVLVEGGGVMYASFLNARAAQRLLLFTAPKKFGKGSKTFHGISVSFKRKMTAERQFAKDEYREYDLRYVR